MSCTALLLLMSLVSFGSCASSTTPTPTRQAIVFQEQPISFVVIEIADFAKEHPLTAFAICIILTVAFLTFLCSISITEDRYQELLEKERQLTAILEKEKLEETTKEAEESWDTPKSGDRPLLFFISEVKNIFAQMSTFTKTWTSHIDNLDDLFGVDSDIEYFYQYMIKLSENGTKLIQLENTLKMEDFSEADWEWSKETTAVFDYKGCGFVESIGKIADCIEAYAASQKEYIDTVTDETVLGLNKKLLNFVKNGKAFVKYVEESDARLSGFDVVPKI